MIRYDCPPIEPSEQGVILPLPGLDQVKDGSGAYADRGISLLASSALKGAETSDTHGLDTPGAEQASQNESRPDTARFKFIYWEHSPENASELAPQLKDCDVIGVEAVGLSDEESVLWSKHATAMLSSSTTPEEYLEASEYLEQYETVYGHIWPHAGNASAY